MTPKNKDGKWKNLKAFLASKRSNRESGQIFFPSKNNFMIKGVLILWEKVRTTNFTTSKTKKNIKKFGDHHYIKNLHKSDQNIEKDKDQNIKKTKITTSKVVDHYYKNHNVEKNEKNIKKISFVWFSHFDYLWRKYLWHFGVNKNFLTWLNLT